MTKGVFLIKNLSNSFLNNQQVVALWTPYLVFKSKFVSNKYYSSSSNLKTSSIRSSINNKSKLSIENFKYNFTRNMSSLDGFNNSLIEKGKKASAFQAIDENLTPDVKVMGIGSGSTIVYAVERLAERVKSENLDIVCIPSSFQSKQLLSKYNLKVSDLESHTSIDLTIDGADEVDKDLTCIKGGGGCHLQEKLIAFCAKKFVVIADIRKKSTKLGQNWHHGIPIEVLPLAYKLVQETIEKLYGGKAVLREYSGPKAKAGPVVTDNGNFIIDWKFESKDDNDNVDYDWKSINVSIKMIPGVIETGLFIGMAKAAYFGNSDGTVVQQKSNH